MASQGNNRRGLSRVCFPVKGPPTLKGSRATCTTTPIVPQTKTVPKNVKEKASKPPKQAAAAKPRGAKRRARPVPRAMMRSNQTVKTAVVPNTHPTTTPTPNSPPVVNKKDSIQDSDNDDDEGEDVLAESDKNDDQPPPTQPPSTQPSPSTRSSTRVVMFTQKPDTAARRKTHGTSTPRSQTRTNASPTPISKCKETAAQKRKRAKLQVDRLTTNG